MRVPPYTYICCTNLLSMSSSGVVDVQEKKDPTEVVRWNVYEALHDHFKRQLDNSCDPIAEEVQNVQLK